MTEIVLSLHPKWWKKIASGEKTVEIRTKNPKDVPFRAYIYETQNGGGSRKIVGEFTVNRVIRNYENYIGGNSCLTDQEIQEYGGGSAFGWLISDVKVYETPKSLRDFGFIYPPQSWRYTKGSAE